MEKENIPRLKNVDYKTHLLRLHEYKWCVCPEGNGPDTHRLWECIYMKTIPIVVRSEFIENLKMDYKDIPLMVLETWDEFSLEKIKEYNIREIAFEKTIQTIEERIQEILPQRIPRKIYQTWKTNQLSSGLLEVQERIKIKNPNYEMILFDDHMMDNYINHTQPPEIQECYHQLVSGTAKADLWRYIILYEEGGVYLDMDAEITGSLDEWIQQEDRAILSREGNKGYFLQWMMVFEKGHSFLKRTLELCVENIKQKKQGTIFEITGPKMYTQAIIECTGNVDLYDVKDKTIIDETYRIYGIDYPDYGKFKHDKSNELYGDHPHWTCSVLPLYKEPSLQPPPPSPPPPPLCTFGNLGSHGRLGNVLFQYAALLGYAAKKGSIAKIPNNIDEKIHHSQKCMLKEFNITAEESETLASVTYTEQCDGGHYDANLWEQTNSVNLQGHFESEHYFRHISNKIKKEFETKMENPYPIEKIGIHFRRGDDVTINHHEYTTQEHNKRFITNGLDYLKKQNIDLENTEIILFTGGTRETEGTKEYIKDQNDDREWCVKFMANYFPHLKIKMSQSNHNSVMEDFMKMQKCENLIINSASSMAWWAGYLNKIEGKRILVGPAKTKSETTYWPNEFIQIM